MTKDPRLTSIEDLPGPKRQSEMEIIVPKKLQSLMYGLMKEARRWSFIEFCENWGIDYETDYKEIEGWFSGFGIKL